LGSPTWFTILKTDFEFGEYSLYCDAFYRTLNPAVTNNHTHNYYEIHFVTSGCKKVTLNFTEEIYLRPGEFLLIGPEVFHMEMPMDGEEVCTYSISISVKSEKDDEFMFGNLPYYYIRSDSEKLIDSFMSLEREIEEKKTSYKNLIPGHLILICGKLIRLCGLEQKEIEKEDTKMLQRKAIDVYFSRIFNVGKISYSIEELANKLFISPRHLNRILHELYGMSFNERVTYTKLKYAEYLLLQSDKTVDQISEECSWSSTYLIRSFKEHYGETPLQFKKNHTKRT